VKSRIRIRIEVKIQQRLKIEPWKLIIDAWMLKMEPWRGSLDQWSQTPITLMRIRIYIRIRIKVKSWIRIRFKVMQPPDILFLKVSANYNYTALPFLSLLLRISVPLLFLLHHLQNV
jgi:hypothetical protein